MSWIGKIVGGTFGLFLGGPLGMIAGAAFGHLYDASAQQGAGSQQPFGQHQGRINSEEQAQMVFFVAAFSMLGKIATADGTVTQAEKQRVSEFIDQQLHLRGESRDAALRIFQTAQHSGGTFEQFAQQFYQMFRTNQQMLELMIDMLYRVSFADGKVTQAEEALIKKAGGIFHFSEGHLASIRTRYASQSRGSSAGAYAVLGIDSSASDDEVKQAYRKLVSEYHPDKIASKGLPEEFITFANDKFREIQSAYEEIRKARNL
ncbi:MAG: co-chaperone DjlA [Spirochaetota bacterium]